MVPISRRISLTVSSSFIPAVSGIINHTLGEDDKQEKELQCLSIYQCAVKSFCHAKSIVNLKKEKTIKEQKLKEKIFELFCIDFYEIE